MSTGGDGPARARARVAVVEDDPDCQLLMMALLEEDYEVLIYASGEEALARMAADAPALLLLDQSLPQMGGAAVLAAIRGDAALRRLPIVALTGDGAAGAQARLLAAGFDGYLSKPILDPAVLLREIETRLRAAAC